MDNHAKAEHESSIDEEPKFFCKACDHEFNELMNYNSHIKIHDEEKRNSVDNDNDISVITSDASSKHSSNDNEEVKLNNTIQLDVESEQEDDELASIENLTYFDILEYFISSMDNEVQKSTANTDEINVNMNDVIDKDEQLDKVKVNTDEVKDNLDEVNENMVEVNATIEEPSDITGDEAVNPNLDGGKMLTCDKCTYVARNEAWLGTHIKKHHSSQPPAMYPDYDDMVELTCRLCVFEGKTSDEIDNHMEAIHDLPPKFACYLCEYRAKTKDYLNLHVKTHNQTSDFACNLCDYRTIIKDDIEKHIKTAHVTVKVNIQINDQLVLSCEECEYKCRFNIQLKKHMESKHCEQGKYKCALCSFNGNFLHDIWQHRQTVHADTIPESLPKSKSSQDIATAYLAEQNLELMEEMETL